MEKEFVQISLRTYNRYLEIDNKRAQTIKERKLIKGREARLKNEINKYEKKISELESTFNRIQHIISDDPEYYTIRHVKDLGFLKSLHSSVIHKKLKAWNYENSASNIIIKNFKGSDIRGYHKDAFKACYDIDLKELN